MRRAHIVAYELDGNVIGEGEILRHFCDNPPCCNPAHLLTGSHLDNCRDKVARGRARYVGQVGATNPRAVLSEDDVLSIWGRIQMGETNTAIAKGLGVSHATISAIRRCKTWRHLRPVV